MGSRKKDPRRSDEPQHRFELRVDPDWLERVRRQAERRGLSAAAYIRQAASMQLEKDEASQPHGDDE